jgi:hypothetical protein
MTWAPILPRILMSLFYFIYSLKVKGIVSRDGVSIETIGGYISLDLNNSPRIGFSFVQFRIKKDTAPRTWGHPM